MLIVVTIGHPTVITGNLVWSISSVRAVGSLVEFVCVQEGHAGSGSETAFSGGASLTA
jgi:hypothetical protein